MFGFKNGILAMLYFSDIYTPTRNYFLTKQTLQNHQDTRGPSKVLDNLQFELDFPPLKPTFRLINVYEFFMNIIQISNTLAIVCVQAGLERGSDCYIFGRYAGLPPALGGFVTLLASVVHLVWKIKTNVMEKIYRIDLVPFLLRDQKLLKEQFERNTNGNRFKQTNGRKCSQMVETVPFSGYMKDVLYIKLEDPKDGKIKYILRPNRTPENRSKMVEMVDNLTKLNLLIVISVAFILSQIAIWGAIFDIAYIKTYPTCADKLEQLASENKLGCFSVSFQLPDYKHHRIAAVVDILYSLHLVVEASVTCFTPTALMMILAEDLMIYWMSIEKEINRSLSAQRSMRLHESTGAHGYKSSKVPMYPNRNAQADKTNRFLFLERKERRSKYISSDKQLDIQMQISQRLIIDFFLQLRYYDRYVSWGLTVGFLVWAAIFVYTSYVALSEFDSYSLMALNALRIGGIGLAVSPLFFLVKVKKVTATAYPRINTLMAHDNSNARKLVWLQILEFYTNTSNHYGFTLMHSFQVDWKLPLQLLGSSISLIIVLETYKKYVMI